MTIRSNDLEKESVRLPYVDTDPTSEDRKRDHIELAFRSQVATGELDARFYYEPILSAHPQPHALKPVPFLGKELRSPIWVSSMTGGTELARRINHNLARVCRDFGMGMGLGSCRSLLYSDDRLEDFAIRPLMGNDLPFYANLGIAQLEKLIVANELYRVGDLIDKLQADGLIIHVNPLQEWLQPEGDHFLRSPLETIQTLLDHFPDMSLIVKEVGQGMGPESLRALLQLPLAAIDFAANGGTNFSKLELLRSQADKQLVYGPLANVGHSAAEMVDLVNELVAELGPRRYCKQIIVSGGVRNFLDGYYLLGKLNLPGVYGQASGFLRYAREDYDLLHTYAEAQVKGLELAHAYLRIRQDMKR